MIFVHSLQRSILILYLGLSLMAMGMFHGGASYLLFWPSFNFLLVGGGTFTNFTDLFGKGGDGRLRVVLAVVSAVSFSAIRDVVVRDGFRFRKSNRSAERSVNLN